MTRRLICAVTLSWIFLAAAKAPKASDIAAREELLWHHRNLGKAFYENPTTPNEAVEEFKQALALAPDSPRERLNYGLALLRAGKVEAGIAELRKVQKQAPEIPHTWFNLGIALKRDSKFDEAAAQLEGMAARVPDEPVTHYNLGTLYKLADKPEAALKEFETAARLGPDLAGPRFQLYNAYRRAGRADDAARELATFQEIKAKQEGAVIPEDLEWSWYSEILDDVLPTKAVDKKPAPELKMEAAELARGLDPAFAGLAVLDADGDGKPDLLAWSREGVQLFRSGGAKVEASGLQELKGVTAIAPGDFDNDGLADLCVLNPSPALYRNAGGRFEKVDAALPAGPFNAAVWLDVDHDYDVDLILLGERSALLRNQGQAGWSDETARFPFAPGKAIAGAVLDVVADTQGRDLVVGYADHPGVIYRDRLGGRFEAQDLAALGPGARFLTAWDIDQDGWTDIAAALPGGQGAPGIYVLRNARDPKGTLEAGLRVDAPGPIAFADLENRGVSDLVTGRGLYRDPAAPVRRGAPGLPPTLAAVAAADFDGDGRLDLAAVGQDGVLSRLRNITQTGNRWLSVALTGVKNLKLAPGATVEVKAGSSFQKKAYLGVPLVFGLGAQKKIDTVRITWPNGLIQNEMKTAAGALRFEEAPRLSGSCPMIFTWDGKGFRFITDVLGVAPLGASAGDGTYFPVDHDEYIQIPGEALALRDGKYEVRITEELREVSYLDAVHLIAVDHPAGLEIFTNDKFKSPPFPEFRLFGAEKRIHPVTARDGQGRDVLPRLLARDQTYPDDFRRNSAGVAELHTLDLDFGQAAGDGRAVLLLSGWVDWADGSTFLGAAQESQEGLVFPYLQVKDAAGQWRTVIADMGIPSGKPKTIAVDLTGKFLSPSREVRIVTSLCVYWDEIFLAEAPHPPTPSPIPSPRPGEGEKNGVSSEGEGVGGVGAPLSRGLGGDGRGDGGEGLLTELSPTTAILHYRGFSRPVIDPQRRQPERFDYASWMPITEWNPTPGLYTRYGDVQPLLAGVDDLLVVMGSGDEARLTFDAAALPAVQPGWRRDFLLLVDGWAKDADANTAFSQTVEPLPFHGMSSYPYPAGEHFPDDLLHTEYRKTYNIRPALRLLHPLRSGKEISKP
jgi:tetratricopeptide (TPR) repeat protein